MPELIELPDDDYPVPPGITHSRHYRFGDRSVAASFDFGRFHLSFGGPHSCPISDEEAQGVADQLYPGRKMVRDTSYPKTGLIPNIVHFLEAADECGKFKPAPADDKPKVDAVATLIEFYGLEAADAHPDCREIVTFFRRNKPLAAQAVIHRIVTAGPLHKAQAPIAERRKAFLQGMYDSFGIEKLREANRKS